MMNMRPPPAALFDRQTAILLSAGMAAEHIRELAAHANQHRCDIFEAAITENYIDELTLYKAIADELRLPFARHGFEIAEHVAWLEAVQTGIAVLEQNTAAPHFVLAPKGEGVRHLLLRYRNMNASGGIMTTPDAFQRAVMRAHGQAIATMASDDLEKKEPKDTAHTLNYGLSAGLFSVLLMVMVAVAVLAGLNVFRWISLLLGSLFLLNISVRLSAVIAAWDNKRFQAPPLADHLLPVYSVFVPLYREAGIIPQLMAALEALDYPRNKLDVQILIEESDSETQAALTHVALPSFMRLTIIPAGQPQTKPRALNVGLALARGSLCTVYDAEDRPEPDQLRKAAAMFASLPRDYACLQARLAVDHPSETWVTRFFALEYASLFDVIIPGLAAQQLPFGLGGTSNHFRIAHMRTVGGWDAWNVTEDADVGMRLFRKGLRIGALDSTTFEEAPVDFRMWFNQRTRWMKGWLQTSLVHVRAPAALTFRQLPFAWATTIALTFGTVISALFGPLLMVLVAYELASGWLGKIDNLPQLLIWTFALTLSLIGIATMVILGLTGAVRRNLLRLAPWIALYPVYYLMMTLAAWRAVKDFVRQPYHWRKTDHGVAQLRVQPSTMLLAEVKSTSPAQRLPIPEKVHQHG